MTELPRPTEFELAILRVLWRRKTATVRQVFEELKKERQLGYNTVLKTMLILLDKGLVVRDESERSHIYRSTRKEQETQAGLLRDLLHRAFGGSSQKLVMAALKEAPLSRDEASEVKALLEEARKRRGE
jgi:predicted transcriptional regulator